MSRRAIERVGLVGAGRMGGAIGRHLLAAGTPLVVCDPSPDAAAAAARSELLLVVVVDDEQVRESVTAALETAAAGSVVAICASVRPDTCTELAAAGAAKGVEVIDCALVRGERGAEEGALVLYCGGPADVVDRIRPVCTPFTEAIVRVGEVGAGQIAKTANNILLWACIRADVEAMRLARALGVEPAALREALALGSGANRPLAEWGKHRLRWPHKDLEVALALAADAAVDVPLVARLRDLMAELRVDDLHELL